MAVWGASALLLALWRCVHWAWALGLALGALARRFRPYFHRRHKEYEEPTGQVPKHVAVIVCDEAPPPEELAKLLVWSLAARIRHFTFYDPDGKLKKKEDKLFSIVEKLKADAPGEINWADHSRINGYKNGTDHRISVNILSRDDGRARIVSLIKQMCSEDPPPGGVTVERMEARLVDARLPEPNLVIYFSEMCCPRGLLPWHIRLSEFLKLNVSRDDVVQFRDYAEVLNKYRRCEQRFGK